MRREDVISPAEDSQGMPRGAEMLQAERRSARAMLRWTSELSRSDSSQMLVSSVARGLSDTLGVDYVGISFVQDAGGGLLVQSLPDYPGDGMVVPMSGLGGLVVRTRRAFVTSDYLADTRFTHDPRVDQLMRSSGVQALAALPLWAPGDTVGVLSVSRTSRVVFDLEELEDLGSVADIAGHTLQRLYHAAEAARGQQHAVANEIKARATRTVLEGRSVKDLVESFGVLLSADLVLVSGGAYQRFGLRAEGWNAPAPMSGHDIRLLERLLEESDSDVPVSGDPALPNAWIVPVVIRGRRSARLIIHRRMAGTLEPWLLSAVADAVGLVLFGEHSIALAERQFRGDIVADLISCRRKPGRALEQRAARFDLDLTGSYGVVVARSAAIGHGGRAALASQLGSSLHADIDGLTVYFAPKVPPVEQLSRILPGVGQINGEPPCLGVAVSSSYANPSVAYAEARRFLEFAEHRMDPGAVASRMTVGLVGMVFGWSDEVDSRAAVDDHIARLIGKLVEYDATKQTDLVQTLRTYLDMQSNHVGAARALHLHPNTLYRRLDRITDLIGEAWRESEHSLDLRLALYLAGLAGAGVRGV